jgi:hypothetical protein
METPIRRPHRTPRPHVLAGFRLARFPPACSASAACSAAPACSQLAGKRSKGGKRVPLAPRAGQAGEAGDFEAEILRILKEARFLGKQAMIRFLKQDFPPKIFRLPRLPASGWQAGVPLSPACPACRQAGGKRGRRSKRGKWGRRGKRHGFPCKRIPLATRLPRLAESGEAGEAGQAGGKRKTSWLMCPINPRGMRIGDPILDAAVGQPGLDQSYRTCVGE